jgi:tripartite-type tricarboxylate transporter receptor subunit TctC
MSGKSSRRHALAALLAISTGLGLAGTAQAQTFPSQPIRLVVPAAPGGSTDILARSVARVMQEQTGATVIVDNKAGAGGVIGVQAVAQAAPNGYTLLVTVPDGVTVIPNLRKDVPYKPTDLTPIGMIAETSWVFAVNPKVPAANMKELIQLAAAKPGEVKFASPGTGTSAHLIVEMLALRNNVRLLHVPYKGANPASQAVIAGEVDMIATSPISLKSFVDAGQMRALGITGGSRTAAMSNVPTMVESGFPDFVASAWFGVFAPGKLPPALAERLEAIVTAAVNHPDIQQQIVKMGLDARPMNRADFVKYVAADNVRWRQVIERAKITLAE